MDHKNKEEERKNGNNKTQDYKIEGDRSKNNNDSKEQNPKLIDKDLKFESGKRNK